MNTINGHNKLQFKRTKLRALILNGINYEIYILNYLCSRRLYV